MSKEPFSFGPVAAEYAALGLPVFQLKIKGKEAAVMNWREVATTDPSAALKWWDGDTNRLFNIGVARGKIPDGVRRPAWGWNSAYLDIPDRAGR